MIDHYEKKSMNFFFFCFSNNYFSLPSIERLNFLRIMSPLNYDQLTDYVSDVFQCQRVTSRTTMMDISDKINSAMFNDVCRSSPRRDESVVVLKQNELIDNVLWNIFQSPLTEVWSSHLFEFYVNNNGKTNRIKDLLNNGQRKLSSISPSILEEYFS